MSDIVDRLRAACTDWDGTDLPPASEPMDGLHCDVLIAAATEIGTLRQQLAEARAKALEEAARLVDDMPAGPLYAHYDNIAVSIRALATGREG